jgi:hypothetical protein
MTNRIINLDQSENIEFLSQISDLGILDAPETSDETPTPSQVATPDAAAPLDFGAIDYAALTVRSTRKASSGKAAGMGKSELVFALLMQADPTLAEFAANGHTFDNVSTGKDRSGPGTTGLFRSFRIYDTDRVYVTDEAGTRRVQFQTQPGDQYALLGALQRQGIDPNGVEIHVFRLTPKGATKTICMPKGYAGRLVEWANSVK